MLRIQRIVKENQDNPHIYSTTIWCSHACQGRRSSWAVFLTIPVMLLAHRHWWPLRLHRCFCCAVYNDEYKDWIRDTIRPVEYVNQTGVIELGWQGLQQRAAAGEPVVVMVTQATVSRWGSSVPCPYACVPCYIILQ